MKSILALGMVLAIGTSGAACSLGDSSKDADGTTTTTVNEDPMAGPRAPNVCALTSVDEVRALFGDSVRASIDDGRCRFDVGGAIVRLQIWPGPESAGQLAPNGTPVPNIGDYALWTPGDDDQGSVLAVQVKDDVLLFENVGGDLDPDVAKARFIGWAELVTARYVERGVAAPTTTSPDSGEPDPTDPCQLITQSQLEQLLGRRGKRTSLGDTCQIDLGEGSTLVLGPKTSPVTEGALDAINRTTTVKGKVTSWDRSAVNVGDGGVLLVNPAHKGTVDLYVVNEGDLIHVGVDGYDAKRSQYIAIAAAKQIILHG